MIRMTHLFIDAIYDNLSLHTESIMEVLGLGRGMHLRVLAVFCMPDVHFYYV